MAFLLDTNAVIAVLNDRKSAVAKKLAKLKPDRVFISSVVMHELYFGAYASNRIVENLQLVDALQFSVLSFDRGDAKCAGQIRAQLKKSGTPIGGLDVLIAGQALAQGLTLVSRNTREFNRVVGLRCENWQDT